MKRLILIFVLLIGLIVRGQEVRIKFYPAPQSTMYLIYNHDTGKYFIESGGENMGVLVQDNFIYEGEEYLHYQYDMNYPDNKFEINSSIIYGLLWKDMSTNEKNSKYYWDFIKGKNTQVNIDTYLDYLGNQSDSKVYDNLGMGIRFTFNVGSGTMIKKSSIDKVDNEKGNTLELTQSGFIQGHGIIWMYGIGTYNAFNSDFNERYNMDSCKADEYVSSLDELISNTPMEYRQKYVDLKRMYKDYSYFDKLGNVSKLNLTKLRQMGYSISMGVMGHDKPFSDDRIKKIFETASKRYDGRLYKSKDTHMINVMGNAVYGNFLNMVTRY